MRSCIYFLHEISVSKVQAAPSKLWEKNFMSCLFMLKLMEKFPGLLKNPDYFQAIHIVGLTCKTSPVYWVFSAYLLQLMLAVVSSTICRIFFFFFSSIFLESASPLIQTVVELCSPWTTGEMVTHFSCLLFPPVLQFSEMAVYFLRTTWAWARPSRRSASLPITERNGPCWW